MSKYSTVLDALRHSRHECITIQMLEKNTFFLIIEVE